MGRVIRHSVKSNATLTATGSQAVALPPLADVGATVVVVVKVGAAPTGTTPSMTVGVAPSIDGSRSSAPTSGTAITAQTTSDQRIVLQNVLEPFALVTWTITGTTPSFTQVFIDVFATTDQ